MGNFLGASPAAAAETSVQGPSLGDNVGRFFLAAAFPNQIPQFLEQWQHEDALKAQTLQNPWVQQQLGQPGGLDLLKSTLPGFREPKALPVENVTPGPGMNVVAAPSKANEPTTSAYVLPPTTTQMESAQTRSLYDALRENFNQLQFQTAVDVGPKGVSGRVTERPADEVMVPVTILNGTNYRALGLKPQPTNLVNAQGVPLVKLVEDKAITAGEVTGAQERAKLAPDIVAGQAAAAGETTSAQERAKLAPDLVAAGASKAAIEALTRGNVEDYLQTRDPRYLGAIGGAAPAGAPGPPPASGAGTAPTSLPPGAPEGGLPGRQARQAAQKEADKLHETAAANLDALKAASGAIEALKSTDPGALPIGDPNAYPFPLNYGADLANQAAQHMRSAHPNIDTNKEVALYNGKVDAALFPLARLIGDKVVRNFEAVRESFKEIAPSAADLPAVREAKLGAIEELVKAFNPAMPADPNNGALLDQTLATARAKIEAASSTASAPTPNAQPTPQPLAGGAIRLPSGAVFRPAKR